MTTRRQRYYKIEMGKLSATPVIMHDEKYVEMDSDSEGDGHGRQFWKVSGVMNSESPSCDTLLNGAKIRNAEKREFVRGAAL